MLCGEVVVDMATRTHAALQRWRVRLPVWLQLQAAAVAGAPSMPPQIEPQAARPTAAEVDEGDAILARHSAIPDLNN